VLAVALDTGKVAYRLKSVNTCMKSHQLLIKHK